MASLPLKNLISLESILPKYTFPSLSSLLPSILQPQSIDQRLIQLGDQLSQNPSHPPPFFHDNGILKAAPKKKVSHMKRRTRLYAPGKKQVKLNNNLNRCPSCGNYKRSHFLCMHCVSEIKKLWKDTEKEQLPQPYIEEFVNPLDEKVLYPGKTERAYERTLRRKEWLVQRPKTLPVEPKTKK
ncbi:hypothetical protein CANARDRAFT_29857 [[Candida] arabinofermentans NRRL YB-2248]|uniref:Large ribosomal subunit protein bL32m n=1 Tax=[Candida] arabinofermentans NRRL YB-2248 TaxID=983967 RepID=A0A1E4SW27_9ASCO|nr:hypothetical protein CANARDRAFT_29857 [[Candida] arabinofermentans NRRL YB-2248]